MTTLSDVPVTSVIDRDLGWIEFNRRVLAEALDDRTPLLERAKFRHTVRAFAHSRGRVRQAGGLRD